MSLAKVYSRAQLGIEAPIVTVEVHLSGGLPAFSLVGLPEAAVRESRERVRSALLNAGFDFPQRRITVNLAPADLPKEGGRYDLAIAIGILLASSQIQAPDIADHEFIAELALGGELRTVPGVLPAAIACQKAARKLVASKQSCYQAGFVEGLERFSGDSLLDICRLLSGEAVQAFTSHPEPQSCKPRVNLNEVRGQQQAKRALEIAAAGGHNLLMSGNPGSGKSMLAARLPGLLPTLTTAQALETAAIHSVAGLDMNAVFQGQRPFRAPHHSSSAVALVGGGSIPRPGEISLAHNGVLFLDELAEFPRQVLEVLREPLECGEILISRAACQTNYPARFQLIAAMNPCPCGYSGDGTGRCRCSGEQISRYQGRLSGPLLDRIDLHLHVHAISAAELLAPAEIIEQSSEQVAERVAKAYSLQLARQGVANSQLDGTSLESYAPLKQPLRILLATAGERLQMSARACQRVRKVARTIADLTGLEQIDKHCLLEALSFRQMSEK